MLVRVVRPFPQNAMLARLALAVVDDRRGCELAERYLCHRDNSHLQHHHDLKHRAAEAVCLGALDGSLQVSDNVGLTANVENLLDKTYYRRVGFYNGGYFGEPRRFTISVRAGF